MKIFRIMAIFFLMRGLLMPYEFIGEYLSNHNAVGWSVVEDEEKGYYVVLTGECLEQGYYGYCNSYDYGILRVGKYGEEIDYRVIYHYEYTRCDKGGRCNNRRGMEKGSGKLSSGLKNRSEDGGGKIWRLRDGRYAVVIDDIYYSDDFGYYGYPHVMLLDGDLNIIWSKDVNAYIDASTEPGGIKETTDGGLIMYYTKGFGCTDGPTIKIRADNGEEEWRINGSNDIEEVGGGYIRCRLNHIGLIDSNGDSIWERVYVSEVDSNHLPLLLSIDKGIGGGYISAGRYQKSSDTFIGYVVRVDDSGGVKWVCEYPGWFRVNGIFRDGDGYVVGWRPLRATNRLTRIDTFGNIEWERNYGDSGHSYWMHDIRRAADGGYLIVGDMWSRDSGREYQHVYLIKTDSMGLVNGVRECRIEGTGERDYIISITDLRRLYNIGVEIYNLTGRRVMGNEIKKGIYLYRRGDKIGKLLIIRR